MHKMVFLFELESRHLEALHRAAPDWGIVHGRQGDVFLPHLKDAEIVVGWNKDAEAECLRQYSALRWIQTTGAGVDNMPLELLKQRQVMLTNASGVHPNPISEVILGMMLALTRKINQYIRNQVERKWLPVPELCEMHGKTVGILGVGAIGEETARIAKAFRMEVLGLRRSGKPSPYVDFMFESGGLPEILGRSDYVVNILPLTDETRRLIGREAFRLMKPGAYYINVGRGETTDTEALIAALQENRLAGAGLDVVAPEPLPPENPLWGMSNVIITPHSAGVTEFYTDRLMDIFLPNLAAYLQSGAPTVNRVDLDVAY